MSYRMVITFRCDGCGLEVERAALSAPPGWVEPAGLSTAGGPHLCRECVLEAQKRITANIVPIEVKAQ